MGRGGIVDEQALATVIDKDLIGGAALDVFTSEPLPADSPLLHTSHPEKFRFTPHTAWASEEARQRLIEAVCGKHIQRLVKRERKDKKEDHVFWWPSFFLSGTYYSHSMVADGLEEMS